jgi:hypothetical protein
MECWSAGRKVGKNLFILTVWSFLMAAPSTQGMSAHAPEIHAARIQSIRPFELNRDSIVLAQNDQKAAENRNQGNQATSENQDQATEPKSAAKENNKSDGAAAKPLKPFKPSEEIAAEQAVDFPVDI